MKWVDCPERSESIKVQVPETDCLSCGKCAEALQAWLRTLPKVNLKDSEAEELLEKKKRKHGYCPRVRDRAVPCNAFKKLCPYHWLCADDAPSKKFILMLKEEHMFLVKDLEGNITKVPAQTVGTIPVSENTKEVYEVRQQVVGAWSLVPQVKEKTAQAQMKLPEALKKSDVEVLLFDGSKFTGEPLKDMKAVIKLISDNPKAKAALIAKKYTPVFEVKLIPIKNEPTARNAAESKTPGKGASK